MLSSSVSLSDIVARSDSRRALSTREGSVAFGDFASKTILGSRFDRFEGRSVAIIASDPLKLAAALSDLDGWARRLILCPPDLERGKLETIFRDAEIDALVCDENDAVNADGREFVLIPDLSLKNRPETPKRCLTTEWALVTSGTTGDPKVVVHSLASLTAAITRGGNDLPQNWATFYDIRRFGGLQIFFRAAICGGSLILRSAGESVEDFLGRADANNVTHISGTPSHWRLALLQSTAPSSAIKYIRLSGEIADGPLLKALSARYPKAQIVHAYASTEAGVVFDVEDGEAGFPTSLLADQPEVSVKLVDGVLRVRSNRTALRYVGRAAGALQDSAGFVDTGDLIEVCGERCFFLGRRGGIINVGGAKVSPEEVEGVVNLHACVHASLVSARKNAISGSVVQAEIVLKPGVDPSRELADDIIVHCRARLASFKAPAFVRFVPSLNVGSGGKLRRLQ